MNTNQTILLLEGIFHRVRASGLADTSKNGVYGGLRFVAISAGELFVEFQLFGVGHLRELHLQDGNVELQDWPWKPVSVREILAKEIFSGAGGAGPSCSDIFVS